MADSDQPDRPATSEPAADKAAASSAPAVSGDKMTQQFMALLESRGFFGQIHHLESSLAKLAEQLQKLGDATVRRLGDINDLVLHVIALECLAATTLRENPPDQHALAAEVRCRTAGMAEGQASTEKVDEIVHGILARHDH